MQKQVRHNSHCKDELQLHCDIGYGVTERCFLIWRQCILQLSLDCLCVDELEDGLDEVGV